MRLRAVSPHSFTYLFGCLALLVCLESPTPGADCTPVPTGVVSWWSGEGNAENRLGTNHGSLIGAIGFAPGRVGQAFVCGAPGSAVRFQNAAALQVQNFTIEGWVRRDSLVSVGPSGIGFIFGYGAGGYGLALYQGGSLMLTKVGESYVASDTLITDTEFHHVAVTKTGAAVMFYVDGQAYPGPDFQTTFTFSTAPAIGAQGDHLTYQLAGRVDELSIYNRALSQAEVQSIHTAGMLGKCAPSSAPSIVAHPQSRFSFLGQNVNFSTLANGSQPLSYQWLFNGLPLAGEIQPGLMLTNVQPSQAGDYCVVVTNAFGSVTSSIAVLAVGTTRCMSLPEGIISWWSADDNTSDKVGYNNGTVLGDVAYSTGRIGKSFVAGSSASGVRVANDPALRVQDFTIETWAKRENSAAVGPGGIGFLFAYGSGGYGFAAYQDGSLMLTKVGVGYISSGPVLTNLDFHHIAVTKSGSSVTFYVDGIPHPAASYDPGFNFTTTPAIGAQGDNLTYGFYGLIDELSIYNRPLSHDEVKGIYQADSAGKCSPAFPPVVFSHPRSQIALPGAAVAFDVLAGGTRPLGYQWLFNGRTLQGAENPLLVLTNVQPPDLGGYAVVVTNAFGAVTSSVAQLTLHPATAECLPSPAGLAAWWTGEGNAFDNAGTNHGLISGAVDFVPGVAGQAFRFGTNSPAITVSSATNLALRSFTIEAWISPEDISIARPILEFAAPYQLSPLQFWYSTENTPGRLSGYVRDPAGPALEVTTAAGLIPSNQWSHVAFTYDYTSRTALLYVNGFQAGSNSSFVAIQPNTLLPVNLGVRPFGGLVPLPGRRHLGKIDEVSVYDLALSAEQIQSIYTSSTQGKCDLPVPPSFAQHPTDQVAFAGDSVLFTVTAAGARPLVYQWLFNGDELAGATNAILAFTNVTTASSGNYAVRVTNSYGVAVSSSAILTVHILETLFADSFDQGLERSNWGYFSGTVLATNYGGFVSPPNSMWLGGAGYRIVTTHQFDTRGGGKIAFNLRLGNSLNPNWDIVELPAEGIVLEYSTNSTNWLLLGRYDTTNFYAWTPVQVSFPPGARFHKTAFRWRQLYNNSFAQDQWALDDVRILASPRPPLIFGHPQGQTALVGNCVTFGVSATGSSPLSYQWRFNGLSIPDATNSSLVLDPVEFTNAGNYSVTVTNVLGSATSSNAVLVVNKGPATVRVLSRTAPPGSLVSVPIALTSNAEENAIGFTLTFEPALLNYSDLTLGAGASGASLLLNTNQLASGLIGVALSLPAGATFPLGTTEILRVSFKPAVLTSPASAQLGFADQPTQRQIADSQARSLASSFVPGVISIPAADFEGDASPRPSGDHLLSVTDWVLVGRYAALLDYPTNASELIRADCAPIATLGNGAISVADWVQAGRYAVGVDPLTLAGGPSEQANPLPTGNLPKKAPAYEPGQRQLRIPGALLIGGYPNSLPVYLESQGNENALGFSISFDPAVFSFENARLGADSAGGALNVNATQAGAGRLALVLALPTGKTYASGTRETVRITLRAQQSASGEQTISFTDVPVRREVVDSVATPLPTDYVSATTAVNPPPSLSILRTNETIVLTWPGWTTNFVLQESSTALPAEWSDAPVTPMVTNAHRAVILPARGSAKYYKLLQRP